MSFSSLLRFRRLTRNNPVSSRFMTSGNDNSPSRCLSYTGKPQHSSSYEAIIIGGGDFKDIAGYNLYNFLSGFLKRCCILLLIFFARSSITPYLFLDNLLLHVIFVQVYNFHL